MTTPRTSFGKCFLCTCARNSTASRSTYGSRAAASKNAPDLDVAARQDVLYLAARAWMALDLAHPAAARRELERLAAIARRRGVEP
ncbi:divergent polysaccharide deacetylase family protein [Streptomyces durhamensis]|uniref:divergent polysaccharide deacetylase family protein n=1 Tax=Streptomyces durhamensis TaxID=68194 RepID=UPI000B0A6A36|nr:divergent polysaccharide deacetylase family protein [Streptomyces durhamensis]